MYVSWENCGTRKLSGSVCASTWAYSFSHEMGDVELGALDVPDVTRSVCDVRKVCDLRRVDLLEEEENDYEEEEKNLRCDYNMREEEGVRMKRRGLTSIFAAMKSAEMPMSCSGALAVGSSALASLVCKVMRPLQRGINTSASRRSLNGVTRQSKTTKRRSVLTCVWTSCRVKLWL
ncbi:hypothetical protein EYF80_051457 [Liparis tanakae]|uniref:Uncharacterized protein n=1 Tax=Liparis tanakae TaxID=230148 RepID=A0A4Z2FDB5_9TELE|nr:hypothetical protein EYF80_051457 [Liparis tanakae]